MFKWQLNSVSCNSDLKITYDFQDILGPDVLYQNKIPGARFSKALETFRACKAIFDQSVSKNREEYTPETVCLKRTSVHIQLCV